jgi:4-hydroxy 2-oxovalerate aldolase
MKANLIDCTLRDGGYYNNWQFSRTEIQNYINEISKSGIKFVEIGFLFLPMDKQKGLTAYCDNNFFNNFSFPKNINFGIMINASDLINYINKDEEEKKIKTLKKLNNTNLSFVRIACHFDEVFKIKKYIKILKKNNISLFVNIMQISEINLKSIYKICNYSKFFFRCIYLADSLGSLKKNQIKQIVNKFKKNWPYDLGIHAHDNQSLALKNTLYANKLGLNWLDSTIKGMGRGPGNTKTEELIKFFIEKNAARNQAIKKLLSKFLKLKRKFNWGTNYYYNLSGKHKIHPTYIQTMLSDKRYKKNDYLRAINYLKNETARTFNPLTLMSAFKIYKFNKKIKIKNQSNFFDNKDYKQALIIGNGRSIKKIKPQLIKKIKNSKLLIICLNKTKVINDQLVDIRVFCHPINILPNLNYFKGLKKFLLIPYSCFAKNIRNYFNKDFVIDYGIKIKNSTSINKNYITVKSPLALIYTLGFLISKNIEKIFLAGFDGYSKDEPNQDVSFELINFIKKRYSKKNIQFASLTPTKLNVKKININQIR